MSDLMFSQWARFLQTRSASPSLLSSLAPERLQSLHRQAKKFAATCAAWRSYSGLSIATHGRVTADQASRNGFAPLSAQAYYCLCAPLHQLEVSKHAHCERREHGYAASGLKTLEERYARERATSNLTSTQKLTSCPDISRSGKPTLIWLQSAVASFFSFHARSQ